MLKKFCDYFFINLIYLNLIKKKFLYFLNLKNE